MRSACRILVRLPHNTAALVSPCRTMWTWLLYSFHMLRVLQRSHCPTRSYFTQNTNCILWCQFLPTVTNFLPKYALHIHNQVTYKNIHENTCCTLSNGPFYITTKPALHTHTLLPDAAVYTALARGQSSDFFKRNKIELHLSFSRRGSKVINVLTSHVIFHQFFTLGRDISNQRCESHPLPNNIVAYN